MDSPYFVALIDDDEHSAYLLTRALVAQGARDVRCYGDAIAAQQRIEADLVDATAAPPSLIVLDLKAHSAASREFLDAAWPLLRKWGTPLVVLTPELDEAKRRSLLDRGAAAVFERHGEVAAYRRVAGEIVEFWAQTLRPVAVGM